MGRYLKNIRLKPELCLCSPSNRTISTYSIIRQAAEWEEVKFKVKKNLYECDGKKIKSVLKHIKNKYNFVAVIGHEPSLTEFIYENCNFKLHKFPTATIALVVFKDLKKWSAIEKEIGNLEFLISPKQLKTADVK
jgi:phosphohistidine phosphatase